MSTEILIVIGLVFLNGLFAMAELAIVSARKGRLRDLAAAGDKNAKTALELAEAPDFFLATVQIGITLVGILAGVYGGATLEDRLAASFRGLPWIDGLERPLAFLCVVGAITYLSLVIGELVPKRLALSYPEKIACAVSPVLRTLSILFLPLVKFLQFSSDVLVKLLPVKVSNENAVTADDIKSLVSEGTKAGTIEKSEQEIVNRLFRLDDRPVRSVMTPRVDLIWLDVDESLKEMWAKIATAPHSHFPLCEGDIDHLIGFISVKDLSHFILTGGSGSVRDLAHAAMQIPAGMKALQVLEMFKKERNQFAVVIDEHGATVGLVTAHDLLEALVGSLGKYEEGEPEVLKRPDGTYLVDASIDLHELWERLEITLPEDIDRQQYYSLGGLVMQELGHVPKEGERFEKLGLLFDVIDMDGHRIDKVIITKLARGEEEEGMQSIGNGSLRDP